MQDFFGWMRSFGIYRPDDGRWAAGVAAGLARRWGVDPILVRGIFVALAFAGGIGVAAYGIGWLLLPQQNGRIHLQEAIHGRFSAGFVGAVLLSLSLFGNAAGDHVFAGPPRVLALLFLIGLIWWMHRHSNPSWPPAAEPGEPGGSRPVGPGADPDYGTPERTDTETHFAATAYPPTPQPVTDPRADPASRRWTPPVYPPDPARASRRITRITLGLALLAGAVIGFAGQNASSPAHPIALIALAASLGVVAAGIVVAGLSGRRSGGLAGIGILLTAVVLIGSTVHGAGVGSGQHNAAIGQFNWQPASRVQAERQYNLGLGQAELRLTDARILPGATTADPVRVTVRVGAGELILTTPQNVPTEVRVEMGAGQLLDAGDTIKFDPGHRSGQHLVTKEVGPAGLPVLIVDVKQGAGEVQLKAAPQTGTSEEPSHV